MAWSVSIRHNGHLPLQTIIICYQNNGSFAIRLPGKLLLCATRLHYQLPPEYLVIYNYNEYLFLDYVFNCQRTQWGFATKLPGYLPLNYLVSCLEKQWAFASRLHGQLPTDYLVIFHWKQLARATRIIIRSQARTQKGFFGGLSMGFFVCVWTLSCKQ